MALGAPYKVYLVFVEVDHISWFGGPVHWEIVVNSVTFERYGIAHNDRVILTSESDRTVCATVKFADLLGGYYATPGHRHVLASPSLLKNLLVTPGTETTVTLGKCNSLALAEKVTLNLLEVYDPTTKEWKQPIISEHNAQALTALHDAKTSRKKSGQNTVDVLFCPEAEFLEYFGGNDSTLYPSAAWYSALLRGDFTQILRQELGDSVLYPKNSFHVSLDGHSCLFEVQRVLCYDPKSIPILNPNTKYSFAISALKIFETVEPEPNIEPDYNPLLPVLGDAFETLNTQVFGPLLSDENVDLPGGVLLHGPPGCGKTWLANTLKKYYKKIFKTDKTLGFKMVASTDLISNYIGKTEENINEMFKELREKSKDKRVICFIDEIDFLCLDRSKTTDSTSKRILTTVLNNFDGINTKTRNFVIFGMTNCIEDVDNALRRPGRFDLEIEVSVPNQENRLLILKNMLRRVKHSLSYKQIRQINEFCQAFVGADLNMLITNANHAKNARLQTKNGSNTNKNETHAAEALLTYPDFIEALKFTKPSAMRELHVEVPQVRWSDIGGYDELKKTIKQSVEYPRKFSKLYESMNIQVPRGILLFGPPGCSKTLMAKAICTESHMNFICVRGPEVFAKYVGESEKNVRKIFSKARTNSPCVIFFDEIDSICIEDSTSSARRVVATLLNEMDGISPLKQVLVIGATNRPQDINKALLRPGRFDRLIYVPLPDLEARKEILRITFKRIKVDFDVDQVVENLAAETQGFSGAEIVGLCRQASMTLLAEVIEAIESRISSINSSDPSNSAPACAPMSADLLGLEDDLEKLSLSEARPLTYEHLKVALNAMKPVTPPEMVKFYEQFSSKIKI